MSDLEKLERLAALLEKGLLTHEEFTAQKAKILNDGETRSAKASDAPAAPQPSPPEQGKTPEETTPESSSEPTAQAPRAQQTKTATPAPSKPAPKPPVTRQTPTAIDIHGTHILAVALLLLLAIMVGGLIYSNDDSSSSDNASSRPAKAKKSKRSYEQSLREAERSDARQAEAERAARAAREKKELAAKKRRAEKKVSVSRRAASCECRANRTILVYCEASNRSDFSMGVNVSASAQTGSLSFSSSGFGGEFVPANSEALIMVETKIGGSPWMDCGSCTNARCDKTGVWVQGSNEGCLGGGNWCKNGG